MSFILKKIKLYLESSALWALYYDELGAKLIEKCLIDEQIECLSSIWTQLELERGINKRENQKEITHDEAEKLRIFIETDCKSLLTKKQLTFLAITDDDIFIAKRLIRAYNLFASDAIQLASAIQENCHAIIVDDYHFKRLDEKIKANEGLAIHPTSKSLSSLKNEIKL